MPERRKSKTLSEINLETNKEANRHREPQMMREGINRLR